MMQWERDATAIDLVGDGRVAYRMGPGALVPNVVAREGSCWTLDPNGAEPPPCGSLVHGEVLNQGDQWFMVTGVVHATGRYTMEPFNG